MRVGFVAGIDDTAFGRHRHLHRLVSVGNMPELSANNFWASNTSLLYGHLFSRWGRYLRLSAT
jgi:hypothetical protein